MYMAKNLFISALFRFCNKTSYNISYAVVWVMMSAAGACLCRHWQSVKPGQIPKLCWSTS